MFFFQPIAAWLFPINQMFVCATDAVFFFALSMRGVENQTLENVKIKLMTMCEVCSKSNEKISEEILNVIQSKCYFMVKCTNIYSIED